MPSSPFPPLAAAWARAGPPGADLVDRTREALATVQPADLSEVAGLAETLIGRAQQQASRGGARRALWTLLDALRRRFFTEALRPEDLAPWTRLGVQVIDRADYTFGEMLLSREETDPRAVAIRTLGAEAGEITIAGLARRTRAVARGLWALLAEKEPRVAILSENSVEAALVDLACLSNGIVSFPLPANALAEQVAYMLRHSGARVLVAEDDEQLGKVLPALSSFTDLEAVVSISPAAADRHGLLSLDQVVDQGGGAFDDEERAARAAAVRSRDLATVMYSSGTTGAPKGVTFTHLNLLSKRLCRGFALPSVGDGDVFLCYLPLYHTFGRWLELAGTLWWGATYVFARSTGQAALAEDFRAVRPTVFISVPKKWAEIQEAAQPEGPGGDPEERAAALRAAVGGRLRIGLSAAGYLDPVVFRAFHRAGVELHSGYGMTEATGGVLMTPAGEYVDGSVGKPLPGIDCRIAEDGELLLRGPYVSPGYFGRNEGGTGTDPEGWFHTGDLFAVDEQGHYRITGRKKEIYKNRQGQTIAPQRVENLFRDFDAVAQAFLVGDHRDYNTLLVWPNYQGQPALAQKTPPELRELIASLVASANRFLAPFERVVDFQILGRALDEAHGEVTAKHSFRREAVERNWAELIERMYAHKHLVLPVGRGFLRIPTWVMREMGVLQGEVRLEGGVVAASGRELPVGEDPAAPGSLRIGDLAYATDGAVLDLGGVLATPALWLGNEALRAFVGEETFRSLAAGRKRPSGGLRLDPRLWAPPEARRLPALLDLIDREEVSTESIHAAGEVLRAERPEARRAVLHLARGLPGGRAEHANLCRALLRRAADSPDEEIRRLALRVLLPGEEPGQTLATLRLFLDRLGPLALRDEDLLRAEEGLTEEQARLLEGFLSSPEAWSAADASDRRLLIGTMRLLTAFAVAHPRWYAPVRVPLARFSFHADEEVAARASEELDRLRRGFSHWIGPNLRRAIDPDTGDEYGWKEVVAFEHGIPGATRELLLRAFADTTLVRSSAFLFGNGALLSLVDLAPGGASVTHLGTRHGKSVYRLSLHTRTRETFDIAVNLVEDMHPAALREEIGWLLAMGAPPPLVEGFGGYYPEYGMFTEEFIPGETVARQVARLERQGERKRLRSLWPFLAWTSATAHLAFWDRTGQRLALRDPSPDAFIVPSHDYQAGTRIVSISDRCACDSFEEAIDRFEGAFLAPVQATRPDLLGEVAPEMLLSAAVEALGLPRARALLESARSGRRAAEIDAFLDRVERDGYTPQRVFFAIRRYQRWLEATPAATAEARGKLAGELWTTYRLAEMEQAWPDTRVRFFRRTVFAGARQEVAEALDRLLARARSAPRGGGELEEQVAALRAGVRPTAEEDYFLARMTYRYLAPGDDVSLISLASGTRRVTEPVLGLRDEAGERYYVRGPASPREVARLLQIFHESQLPVVFASEHEFLLALDGHDSVIGGIYHRRLADDRVHMEKIVVARHQRGKGVADGLMREFVRRLRSRGVTSLETGYFQPEYLRRFGFRTDPGSGGLALDLTAKPTFRW